MPGVKQNEGREIRTPNLLIWSQTRCHCAMPPCDNLSLWDIVCVNLEMRRADMRRDAKNCEVMNRDAKNKDAKNRDVMNRDARNKDAKNRDAEKREAKNRDVKQDV